MKFLIATHETNISHWTDSIERDEATAERLLAEIARSKKELSSYRLQLEVAKKRGLTEFDRDRFLMPRKKRSAP